MIRCRSGEIYNSKNKYVNKSTYMTVYRSRHLKKSLFQLFGFWYACVVKRLPFGLQKATYSDGSDLQNAGDENTQGSLSSDSHGLAYFHLRRLIPCRRENLHRKLPCHWRSKIGNRISCKIVGHYCATLKTLLSFSLNAAISCPILSLVILA